MKNASRIYSLHSGAVILFCTMLGFALPTPKSQLTPSMPNPQYGSVDSLWENATTSVTSGQGHENHRGSAWCDFNNDGLLDLYATHFGQFSGTEYLGSPNQLLKNLGNGEFVDVATEISAVGSDLSHHSAWADIDNDGLPDLFVGQSTNYGQDQNYLLQHDAVGLFSDITNGNPLAMYWMSPRGVSWQDVNLDGYVDLMVTNSGGDHKKNWLMINQGDNTFVRDSIGSLEAEWKEGRGAAWTDFDNDGLADLYVVNGSEDNSPPSFRTNVLFKNNGDGTWTDVATEAGVADVGHGRGVAWGDINNDGYMDILVGNQVGSDHPGYNKLYVNNGDGTFSDISESAGITENVRTRCVSMADYNNDGLIDLYTVSFGTSVPPNRLYRNNGDLTFTNVAVGTLVSAPNNGNSTSWADYDNDGWIDLFTVGGSPTVPGVGMNQLIRNANHDGSHWIEFELCGTVTNRTAIGTRVSITHRNENNELISQMREVQSGSGYNSQHMFRTHFGLGASTIIEEVTISWPSGTVQTTSNLDTNQIIRVVESHEFALDCNRNCIDDYTDILDGTSLDSNGDGIPDECNCTPTVDCNENCIEDSIDIQNGTSADANGDGVPDECECAPLVDCNDNCVEDALDIENGTSLDLDGNGVPDECPCPVVYDCNANCIEDAIDILNGDSYDSDENGVPDECECMADFNNNNEVDIDDMLILFSEWEATDSAYDLTGDGVVSIDDLLVIIDSFGPCHH